jgi:hypothetical protein
MALALHRRQEILGRTIRMLRAGTTLSSLILRHPDQLDGPAINLHPGLIQGSTPGFLPSIRANRTPALILLKVGNHPPVVIPVIGLALLQVSRPAENRGVVDNGIQD